ncbi:unnamed protein product [Sphagnum jensenii]|jgi:hypothetical protein|uniref:Late embryogenesis abundant protein LEA-2 subgroup domain-containing protein n=1 Tax=Sphagnum jensenii TaxID=128206 RepID=A0ABP0W5Y5_9BRYO
MSSLIYPVAHDEGIMHFSFVTKGSGSPPLLPTPVTYSSAAERRKRRRGSGTHRCCGTGRGVGGVCCCILSSLCAFLVASIVILGITALILWLVLRPQAPHYSLQQIQFQKFSVDADQQGSNQQQAMSVLNADIQLTIEANNPNKHIGILYDSITTSASYDGNEVGNVVIPPFYQGHHNITDVKSQLKIVNYPLTQTVASSLRTDIANNSVPFRVRTSVKARVKIGSYKSFAFWVHVTCNLSFSPPTSSNPNGAVINKSCQLTR